MFSQSLFSMIMAFFQEQSLAYPFQKLGSMMKKLATLKYQKTCFSGFLEEKTPFQRCFK